MWFRGDLRLHDNEALTRANSESSSLLAVYCFDPRDYGKSSHGYDKTGPYRAHFLIQAVADLRKSLRAAGSELLVRLGKPEEIIPDIVRKIGAAAVYCQLEPTCEENQVESKLKLALEREGGGGRNGGVKLQSFWGGTLHDLNDLPYSLASLPQTFEQYRASLKHKETKKALEKPSQIQNTPIGVHFDAGKIPTLAELGLKSTIRSNNSSSDGRKTSTSQEDSENSSGQLDGTCQGGETEALRQLQQFLAAVKDNCTTSNTSSSSSSSSTVTAYGSNFASSIAPWLATGCLSPRRMIEDVKHHLGSGGENSTTTSTESSGQQQSALTWVQFELLWRDFFRMMTRKYTEAPLVKKRCGEVDAGREHGSGMVPAPV